jgi:hypothetical protein
MRKTITVKHLLNCARCTGEHQDLVFKEFHIPILVGKDDPLTHFAICPVTGEPILLSVRVVADDSSPKDEKEEDDEPATN